MDVQTSTEKTEEIEMKEVSTVAYNNKDDEELMNFVNEYARAYNKHVTKKTPPRNALRNYLTEELPKAIVSLTGGNGGQLAGQS